MNTMSRYFLTSSPQMPGTTDGLQKIIDYLISFVGEVEVKKSSPHSATIHYTDTPITASLSMEATPDTSDTIISNQITLLCSPEDSVSVNLIKNVTSSIGYRIFNTQTNSYLLQDKNVLDLTNITLEENVSRVFKEYQLTPLFQYHGSLVYFAIDSKGRIRLVNRHLLEHLAINKVPSHYKDEFSIVVANDIGQFVALFDRGLIPISFYKYASENKRIVNLGGFPVEKVPEDVMVEQINFVLDNASQSFFQQSSTNFLVKKGKSILEQIAPTNYLCIKTPQDIKYVMETKGLVPRLSISVFY